MTSASIKYEMIRDTLMEEDNVLTVKELCEIACVSRSGYYGWRKSETARQVREERDRADFERILAAYRYRGYDKGVRGIHMRLMRKYGLYCPIRKSKSVPQDGEGDTDEQCGAKPGEPGV